MFRRIVLSLSVVVFLSILLTLIHFHTLGGGALHHVDQEEFVLDMDDNFPSNNALGDNGITLDLQKNDEQGAQEEGANEVNNNAPTDTFDNRNESNAFRKIMERSALFQETCHQLPEHHLGEAKPKEFDTGVPPLPEHGVHRAMKEWLEKETDGTNERGDYPVCSLPPSKSCKVDTFTLILMSHTVDDNVRLKKLRNGINNLSSWRDTGEIILVWNSAKSVLTECQKALCTDILGWDADESHKLRIFYSQENGLGNNLLNRYHPMLEPKHEAIVYFDDDGPFHSQEAMDVGFELWKFNSDVQIGSMARNIRFPSKRMDDLQNIASDLAAKHYMEDSWQTHIHPYDEENVEIKMKENSVDEAGYPEFTPICHEQTGDVVEYNYFVFPQFKAHMSLPSGSILHRNYLCFVWHPAFEELRQFILDHPTHPDDMTISTLVSHLIGKPLRTFPRFLNKKDDKRILLDLPQTELTDENALIDTMDENMPARRKLLWQQKDWGNMREEAIDSIVGYFGSINPGSVGWCAGTEYQLNGTGKGNMRFDCISDHNPPPKLSQIPWINEGGLGYNECH